MEALLSDMLLEVFSSANTLHVSSGCSVTQLHKLEQNGEGVSSRDDSGKDGSGASVHYSVLPRCCHPSQGYMSSVSCLRPHVQRPDSKPPGALDPSLTHQSVLPVGSSLCEYIVVLIDHSPVETVYVAACVSKASA